MNQFRGFNHPISIRGTEQKVKMDIIMESIKLTWDEFKNVVSSEISILGKYIYRGQSDSEWRLKTTLERSGMMKHLGDLELYFNHIIPIIQYEIEIWENRKYNLENPEQMAQFLAYLQHNSFPTPLLDWTYSPYMAAFFAFDQIDYFRPQCDTVAIYCFDQSEWLKTYKQVTTFKDKNEHVSIIAPSVVGNNKLKIQQGLFMFTNVSEIESHITYHGKDGKKFLNKYIISVSEKKTVANDLRLMNINSIQLFQSTESVCKKAISDIALVFPMGDSPTQHKVKSILYNLLNARKDPFPGPSLPMDVEEEK